MSGEPKQPKQPKQPAQTAPGPPPTFTVSNEDGDGLTVNAYVEDNEIEFVLRSGASPSGGVRVQVNASFHPGDLAELLLWLHDWVGCLSFRDLFGEDQHRCIVAMLVSLILRIKPNSGELKKVIRAGRTEDLVRMAAGEVLGLGSTLAGDGGPLIEVPPPGARIIGPDGEPIDPKRA